MMEAALEDAFLERVEPTAGSDMPVFGSGKTVEVGAVSLREGATGKPGSPMSSLWTAKTKLETGKVNHWRWECLTGGAEVSVGMATEFGSGWGQKGFFQMSGGNFAGRGLIQGRWAEPLRPPCVVDWYLERSSPTRVVLYSVVDGRPQPAHADIEFDRADVVDQLKPVVRWDRVSGTTNAVQCNVRIFEASEIPTERPYELRDLTRTTAEGDWVFESHPIAEMMVTNGQVALRSGNVMRPPFSLADSKTSSRGAIIQAGHARPGVSTLMMTYGPAADAEAWLKTEFLRQLPDVWEVRDNVLHIGEHRLLPKGAPHVHVTAGENVFSAN